ncbi:MAG TPA: hypothetical protein VFW92_09995 [Candidatus Limnocylindrales bacterium]|nr:hypothetical protein [Candidatus Limnocylindrales bacterium]
MRALPFPARRWARALARPAAALAVAGVVGAAGVAAAAGPPGPALPAGAELPRSVALAAGPAAALRQRASTLARAVGLQGTATAAREVVDPLLKRTVHEIDLTEGGRRTGLLVQDAQSGRTLAIADLAWDPDDDAPRTDRRSAPAAAARLAKAAGLGPPDTAPTVAWDDAADAWTVSWPRIVDGVPVPSDTLTVRLRPGGTLASLSAPQSPLAAAPQRTISSQTALRVAHDFAAGHALDRLSGFQVEDLGLAWSEVNGFAGGTVAFEPTLRLCRVIRISYLPADAADPERIELHVDAGTGQIVGGDQTS